MKTVLVVITDADKLSVNARFETLEEALDEAGIDRRKPREMIAVLIPRRNIETWIRHLYESASVDEETDYPKYKKREAEVGWPASEAFAKHAQSGTAPQGAPPSLVKGLEETRRILAG